MAETFWPPRKLTVADNAAYVGAQGEPVLVLGDDGLVAGMALHDGITLGGMTMPAIDPTTGALIDAVTSQPQLLPNANADIEVAIVLSGESKTLSASGVRGYRLIIHAAIATGAVTVTDSGGTYTLPVGCIGLFEFTPSGDVTINNASNTGGPVTVLEVA